MINSLSPTDYEKVKAQLDRLETQTNRKPQSLDRSTILELIQICRILLTRWKP